MQGIAKLVERQRLHVILDVRSRLVFARPRKGSQLTGRHRHRATLEQQVLEAHLRLAEPGVRLFVQGQHIAHFEHRPELKVVLKIRSHTRQRHLNGHTGSGQHLGISDARQLENLRRPNRARGKHHLPLRQRNDRLPAIAVPILHAENTFRAVNIAMVNELKIIYEKMGIDIWEVLDAAATKPFGFMRFNPGPGWGGHCIPLDPFYLSWKARECGIETKFIELAGEINRNMPRYVINKLQHALNAHGKSVRDSKVMVIGVAYKKDINDDRESPAYKIMAGLMELGANVSYHDPYVPKIKRARQWPLGPELKSQALTSETLAAKDAVLIVTDHTAVDYKLIARHAKLIVDTRGIYRKPLHNVTKA